MMEPRRYRDENDLHAMRDLLMQGRKADNGTFYIHPGDLNWWLFYPPLTGDFWEQIFLWDDPADPRRLFGWALISPHWVAMDVYTQPELKGSQAAVEMYLWTEEMAIRSARENQKPQVNVVWVEQDDENLVQHFCQRGFQLKPGYVYFTRSLRDTIPQTQVAEGFSVRSCKGEAEVASRAKAQYGAFESSAPFERYLERFANFMRSPVYDHDLDVVAAAPDGQIGAFCIVWTDAVNKVGHFEPVGTHPDFQRQGLGSAVMYEGLRRLKEVGMDTADVATQEDNLTAIKFYESIGFQAVNKLGTYQKDV